MLKRSFLFIPLAILAFLVFSLTASLTYAQTSRIENAGSSPPSCLGRSDGVIRLRAVCNRANTEITVTNQEGTIVAFQTFSATTGELSVAVSGGQYTARLTCGGFDQGRVVVDIGDPPPTITIGRVGVPNVNIQALCQVASLSLRGSPPPSDQRNITSEWSVVEGGGTIANSTSSTTVLNNPGSGNNKVKYTWKQSGCPDFAVEKSVLIYPIPVLSPIPNKVVCANQRIDAITFTSSVQGSTFSWANSKPQIGISGVGAGNIDPFVAQNSTSGPITAKITVSALANGCSSGQRQFDLKVYPSLTAVASSAKTTYCTDEPINLLLTTNVGDTYLWTYPNGGTSTEKNPSISRATIQHAGEYRVRVSIGACAKEASLNISIIQGPVLRIHNQQACEPTSVDLSDPDVTTGSSPGLSFSYWQDENTQIRLVNYSAVNVSGTYYILASGGACNALAPVTVTIGRKPRIRLMNDNNPAPQCAPVTIDLSSTIDANRSTAGLTYTYWKDPSATTTQVASPRVSEGGTITYYIRGIVPGAMCPEIISVTTTINPLPVLRLHGYTMCDPQGNIGPGTPAVADLTAASVTAGTNLTNLRLEYFTDAAGTNSLANANNVTTTGNYYIRGTNTITTCSSIAPVNVTIKPRPVLSTVAAVPVPSYVVCDPARVNLTNKVRSTVAQTTFDYYQPNGTTRIRVPPARSGVVGRTNRYVIYGTAAGCRSYDPIRIDVTVYAKPPLEVQDRSECFNTPIPLRSLITSNIGNNDTEQYSYSPNFNPLIAGNFLSTGTEETRHSRMIHIRVRRAYTAPDRVCVSTASARATIRPLPSVTPSSRNAVVCNGGRTSISFSGAPYNLPGTEYTWTSEEVPAGDAVAGETDQGAPVSSRVGIGDELTVRNPGAGIAPRVRYTVTPILDGCRGTPETEDIVVVPTNAPVFNALSQTICSGESTNILLRTATGAPQVTFTWGVAYRWTDNNNVDEVEAAERVTGASAGSRGPSVGGPPATAGRIQQTLTNSQLESQDVIYNIVPTIIVLNPNTGRQETCDGNWGGATITVHPIPTITVPDRVVACDGDVMRIDVESDLRTTNQFDTRYRWTVGNVSGVADFTELSPPNPPILSPITQTLRNVTAAPRSDGSLVYQITPVYAFSGAFAGCSGTADDSRVTVRPHRAPVLNQLVPNPPLPVCDGVDNGVNVPLTATVPGAADQNAASAAVRYTWEVEGDYRVNNQNAVSGFTRQQVEVSGPIQATLSLNANNALAAAQNNYYSRTRNLRYVITPRYNGCVGNSGNLSIEFRPKPKISARVANPSVCSGDSVEINITNLFGSNYTYRWTLAGADIAHTDGSRNANGLTPTITIKDSLAIRDNTQQTVTYTITPENLDNNNGCIGHSTTVDVSVIPTPYLNPVGTIGLCSGSFLVINMEGKTAGLAQTIAETTFTWTIVDNQQVTGDQPNSVPSFGPILNELELVAGTNTPQGIPYRITPNVRGCAGPAETVNAVVYPNPTLQTQVLDRSICSGSVARINLLSGIPNTKYTWTVTTSRTVGGASDQVAPVNTNIVQTLLNRSLASQNVTYSIRPALVHQAQQQQNLPGSTCYGPTSTETITVLPAPNLLISPVARTQTICHDQTIQIDFESSVANAQTPVRFVWTATEQGLIRGQQESGDIIGTVANGVTTGSHTSSRLLNQTNTKQTINYSIKARLATCESTAQFYTVTVYPIPNLTVADPTPICDGDELFVILSSTVNGTSYTWTTTNADQVTGVVNRSDPNNPFTEEIIQGQTLELPDGHNASAVVQYHIQPRYSLPGNNLVCQGIQRNITATINPVPVMTSLSDTIVCSAATGITIPFRANTAAATTRFQWGNNNTSTGLGERGAGTIGPFQAAKNEDNRDYVSHIIVIPDFSGCTGVFEDMILTVKSAPNVRAAVSRASICSSAPNIRLSNPNQMTGTKYIWEAQPFLVNHAESSNDPTDPKSVFSSRTLEANSSIPGRVVYTFRGVAPADQRSCVGSPVEVTITVNPVPTATVDPVRQHVCPQDRLFINLSSDVAGTYSWELKSRVNINSIDPVLDTTAWNISQRLTLTDPSREGTAVFHITPKSYGCLGDKVLSEVTLYPGVIPQPSTKPTDQDFCVGDRVEFRVAANINPGAVNYTWYHSRDEGSNWQRIASVFPFVLSDENKRLVIDNISEDLHQRLFRVKLSDKACPESNVTTQSARLTDVLGGASISARPSTELSIGSPIHYSYRGPTQGVSYSWNFNDGWTSTKPNPTHYYHYKGTYDTRLTLTKGSCQKDLIIRPIVVTAPNNWGTVITADQAEDQGYVVYPVPVQNELTISAPASMTKLRITDLQGREWINHEAHGMKKASIRSDHLVAGVYVLMIQHDEKWIRIKIIKQ